MNFERGLDIKEALSIGNASNPIKIADLYAADPDIPAEYRIHPDSANIKKKKGYIILKAIEHGQIRDWKNRFMIGVYTGDVEPLESGGEIHKFKLVKLGEYAEYYIEYHGAVFKLPK